MQKRIVKMMAQSNLTMNERASVLTSVMFVQLNFKESKKMLKDLNIDAKDLSVEVVLKIQEILTINYMQQIQELSSTQNVIDEVE